MEEIYAAKVQGFLRARMDVRGAVVADARNQCLREMFQVERLAALRLELFTSKTPENSGNRRRESIIGRKGCRGACYPVPEYRRVSH